MTTPSDKDRIEALKEKLAEIEHERWADWQKWCHQVLRENLNDSETMQNELNLVLARWDKQIATPYKDLSEEEKASDMEQVDRYWPLILELIREAKVAELTKAIQSDDNGAGIYTYIAKRLKELS